MKIHELAHKTGLTTPTIRFYEKEGLLDTPYVRREANNYRDYCQEAVELLLLLKKFQAAGFTLAEFKALIQANKAQELSLPKIVELLHQKMKEIDRKQAELEQVQTYLAQMLAHKMALMGAEGKGEE
ncbi:MerR family transcriptional regulator [Dictyobacter aurantiacus]|uniref:MerR family transcriptional regulator n=1 Tax=Dictyobacter aurantiacus TaxID=1936993 RepID=A0A401ZT34_9CHLR|nr:MerR family transcriptional regulator [Dictyobacter aurantiacus]GCE10027.1 MerR family transcriptional regulator [Dictyobacter aurantiacus]